MGSTESLELERKEWEKQLDQRSKLELDLGAELAIRILYIARELVKVPPRKRHGYTILLGRSEYFKIRCLPSTHWLALSDGRMLGCKAFVVEREHYLDLAKSCIIS